MDDDDSSPRLVSLAARHELESLGVSRERFLQLLVFAAACLLTAVNWNILAPVYAVGEARFDVGVQQINSLSNAWNIYSAPGALLALWVTARFGLRASLLSGFASQALCALLAHYAVTLPWPLHDGFALLYASQLVGALGQPLFLNNVTLLAAAWFPSSERDVAVAASLLCVAIGSMVISVYAPYAVKGPGQLDLLFGWQVPAWCAVLVAGLLITKDQPTEPPSISAALLRAQRRAQRGGGEGAGGGEQASSLTQALRLCGHANFMVLNFSSALLTGLVMMMATMVGQMLQPCGHAPDVAGSSLAALSAASGVSVGLYLWLLARNERRQEAAVEAGAAEGGANKSYVAHQLGWSALCAGGIALALGASPLGTSPGDTAAVVAAWGLLGLLSGTLLNGALTMEHAAEMTFPTPPNVSVSLLAITASGVSFLQVLVGTHLLQQPGVQACKSATGFAAFCALCAGTGLLLAGGLRPEYRRAEAEAEAVEAEQVGGYTGVTYGTL